MNRTRYWWRLPCPIMGGWLALDWWTGKLIDVDWEGNPK